MDCLVVIWILTGRNVIDTNGPRPVWVVNCYEEHCSYVCDYEIVRFTFLFMRFCASKCSFVQAVEAFMLHQRPAL